MGIAEISGLVSGVGGAGWWVYKQILKPKMAEAKKQKRKLEDLIQAVHDKTDRIEAELSFNGGGSIKDAIFRIETRLDELTETQKISLNLQNVSYWISNEKGECTYASPALCKLIGRTEDEIKGNNWAAWLVKEDKERIYDSWMFSVEEKSPFDEIYSFQKDDGTIVKVWGLAFHKQVNGKHSGILGKLEPVTIDSKN